jgi:hypothetical protein
MALHSETKAFLQFLQANPQLRSAIAAAPGNAILYAGKVNKAAWQEINEMKRTNAVLARKQTLHDVIQALPAPGTPHRSLLAYAEHVADSVPDVDQNILWRALSGIYASNAHGAVSFYVGSGVSKADRKVFAQTEVAVIERNPNVDSLTRDAIAYYKRCVMTGNPEMNLGLIRDS